MHTSIDLWFALQNMEDMKKSKFYLIYIVTLNSH